MTLACSQVSNPGDELIAATGGVDVSTGGLLIHSQSREINRYGAGVLVALKL